MVLLTFFARLSVGHKAGVINIYLVCDSLGILLRLCPYSTEISGNRLAWYCLQITFYRQFCIYLENKGIFDTLLNNELLFF